LPALTDAEPADRTAAAVVLRDGGAVVTDPRLLTNGQVMLGRLSIEESAPDYDGSVTVPGYLLTTGHPRSSVIISPEAARAGGLEPRPGNLLFTTERMPTQAERDAFFAALADLELTGYVQPAEFSPTASPMLLVLTAAAGLIALGAAGIATGLAAADR